MTLETLLKKWLGKQGAGERAEYQQFLTEFMQALDVPTPGDSGFAVEDYRFEAPVRSEAVFGSRGTKRADLYKRDCFILEAKQSQPGAAEASEVDEPTGPATETVFDLFGNPIGQRQTDDRPRRRYDRLMADARVQAERYALALPDDHRTPPFLIVADIGRAFELYFDWAGNGRGYAPFPDERHYRILLEDLAKPAALPTVDRTAAELLQAIWTDPASVDPRLRAAAVTRDIASSLSEVADQLERDERGRHPGAVEIALGIEATSLFLMRTLFCMFAEDVELLPRDSFKAFLSEAQSKSDHFWRNGLADLWSRMNDPVQANRYWPYGDAIVRFFNGNLFQAARVYDVPLSSKVKLLAAAKADWRKVEPAIFGTLLEQVLTETDRAKFGAHYTPRPYVQRLVEATMMEVLRPEWDDVLMAARAKADAGDAAGAAQDAAAFQRRLHGLRILDPACGTGNFLYVAMEELLRLEGDVRAFADGLGHQLPPLVEPNQFLGLELNPRAAVIAELVLWIGWLRYRLANSPEAIGDPVLPTLSNINLGTHGGYDAVLTRTATGEPDVENPRPPEWPAADFIIGNPPFIGGKDIRDRLGGAYAQALWAANPRVPKSADFVMQWWDRAADILTRPDTRLRRFGFVTTNSITQVFSRRVIAGWLSPREHAAVIASEAKQSGVTRDNPGSPRRSAPRDDEACGQRHGSKSRDVGRDVASRRPSLRESADDTSAGRATLHLTLAIPDHPWTRVGEGAAAVRIAMTVAAAGPGPAGGGGRLVTITGERGLDTDAPELAERAEAGAINADLSVGTDVTGVVALKANAGLCSPGVKLHGAGFIVTPAQAKALGLGERPGLEQHIREYRNGRDLLQRPRGVMVIDLFGLSEDAVMDRFPEVYQHLLKTVKAERDAPKKSGELRIVSYADRWWEFGVPRQGLRDMIGDLKNYIATVETSKHRIFHWFDGSVIPDNKLTLIASDNWSVFGVLSSTIHTDWAGRNKGQLEDRPVYVKATCFDPFPFPEHDAAVARIAERLDDQRRTALAENPSLTMTGLYNLVEEARANPALPPEREAAVVRARARIVAKLHDDLDAAVAAAYGWEWPLPPAEIVARLVALNAARAAEEAAGEVRWLRPDYQVARFGKA